MGKFTYLLMTAAGIIGLTAAISPTWKLLSTLRTVGDAPVPAAVAAAPTGRWLRLTDARLRCDSRSVYKESMTFFLATDTGTANPFVAQFVGTPSCEEAQKDVSGAFVPDPLTLADLAQFGVDAKGATGLRLFTPLATPRYLRMAMVPFVGIFVIGLGVAAFGLRGLFRRRT